MSCPYKRTDTEGWRDKLAATKGCVYIWLRFAAEETRNEGFFLGRFGLFLEGGEALQGFGVLGIDFENFAIERNSAPRQAHDFVQLAELEVGRGIPLVLLEGQGKLLEAVEEFQKALEGSPDFPQANFSLGRVLVKEGKFEEGIPRLLKAVAVADEATKPSYLYAVGIAYADLGDLENGLRYLRLAREKAEAENQSSLLQRIDDDRRLLEGQGGER